MPKARLDIGDGLAEDAVADDAELRSRQIVDRIVEVAELAGARPGIVGDRGCRAPGPAERETRANVCSGTVLPA